MRPHPFLLLVLLAFLPILPALLHPPTQPTFLFQSPPGLSTPHAQHLRRTLPPCSLEETGGGVIATFPSALPSSFWPSIMLDACSTRTLQLLFEGTLDALTPRRLHAACFDLPILPHLRDDDGRWRTFSITTTLLGDTDELNNESVTSRTVKDALVSKILTNSKTRPDVDPTDPEVPLFVTVNSQGSVKMYLSLLSKSSSHRLRGYRGSKIHKAALRPTTAALILEAAGVTKCSEAVKAGQIEGMKVVDPMVGSGTFLVEAALMCSGASPFTAYLHEGWRPVWAELGLADWPVAKGELKGVEAAAARWLDGGRFKVVGNDVARANVEMVEEAFRAIKPVEPDVTLTAVDIDEHKVGSRREDEAVIGVVNPPYPDGRIGALDPEIERTWQKVRRRTNVSLPSRICCSASSLRLLSTYSLSLTCRKTPPRSWGSGVRGR